MDFLIIGAGPAGLSAAAVLRRERPQDTVTILSNEQERPYARMVLPYLLAGAVEESDLYLKVPEGARLETGQEVVRIRPSGHVVETASGNEWHYGRLLIAPGSVPDRPEVEGRDLPFVFTVRNLSDVRGMAPFIMKRANRAVIAGAGPVGMETGDALHRKGMKVTLVVTSNRLFSAMMDSQSAAFLEEKLSDKGVDILKGEDIVRIEEGGMVHLRSGMTIDTDLVVFGKGVKPRTGFLEGSGIVVRSGIVVDGCMRTSEPDVFAAGDAVETMDIASGGYRVNALWPEAVDQGRAAALNMAGLRTEYRGSLARNILRVFGVSVLVAGSGRADGPEVEIFRSHDSFRKLVLDHGVVKGMITVGEVRNEGLHRELIWQGLDMSGSVPSILRGTFSYPRFQRHAMKI